MLVFAYAPWCGHCNTFKPIWNQVKQKYKGKVEIYEVNSDKQSELINKMGVKGFPTILAVNGNNKKEFDGPRTAAGLEKFFKENM